MHTYVYINIIQALKYNIFKEKQRIVGAAVITSLSFSYIFGWVQRDNRNILLGAAIPELIYLGTIKDVVHDLLFLVLVVNKYLVCAQSWGSACTAAVADVWWIPLRRRAAQITLQKHYYGTLSINYISKYGQPPAAFFSITTEKGGFA